MDQGRIYKITNMIRSAELSPCRRYRYSLLRVWDHNKPMCMYIMLNPSSADETRDDPTIRKCIGFAKDWGFGGLIVCNLYAIRTPNPLDLLEIKPELEGDLSWVKITYIAKKYNIHTVVFAWGHSKILNRIQGSKTRIQGLTMLLSYCSYVIDYSIDGTPKHPLYLKKNLKPKPYENKTPQKNPS